MTDFFERAEPVFQLYEQRNYAEALRLADELAQEFPDRAVNIAYWRMCLFAISGQLQNALQVMEQAIANGLWWSEDRLRAEIDLIDLQGDPEFERLVSICEERYQLAKGNTKPELLILKPDGPKEAAYPLLLILHGRDGSAAREKHHWKSASDLGWLTVFAQSSQIGSLDAYVWDDVELARRELREHFQTLSEKYKLNANRIVIGGFSQGAAIAILTALRGDVPATAFIAVVPGRIVNVEDLPALAKSAQGKGLRGVIVAGGKDPRFDTFAVISETLSNHDVPCQLEIRPDVGHAYPADFKDLLQMKLQSIYGVPHN